MPQALLLRTSQERHKEEPNQVPLAPSSSPVWLGAAILFLTLSSDPRVPEAVIKVSCLFTLFQPLGIQLATPEV